MCVLGEMQVSITACLCLFVWRAEVSGAVCHVCFAVTLWIRHFPCRVRSVCSLRPPRDCHILGAMCSCDRPVAHPSPATA